MFPCVFVVSLMLISMLSFDVEFFASELSMLCVVSYLFRLILFDDFACYLFPSNILLATWSNRFLNFFMIAATSKFCQ